MKELFKLLCASAIGFSSGILATLAVFRFLKKGNARRVKSAVDPSWEAGKKQIPPFDPQDTIEIQCSAYDSSILYPLVISAVVPRPIAFISSLSKEGNGNLSPYSYFNVLSHDPPMIAIGHCLSRGNPKDSLRNILETKEFVVAIISDWFLESANHTCGNYPPDVNEMDISALTPLQSKIVKAPRVAESAINMECRVRHTYDIKNNKGDTSCTIILAEVLIFHIAKYVLSESNNSNKITVNPSKLNPASRLGGNSYAFVNAFFEIPRPDRNGLYPNQIGFEKSLRDTLIPQTK